MAAPQPSVSAPAQASPWASAPALDFAVESVEALTPAAVPTLRFALRIDAGGVPVRSVVLGVQIRIAATQRAYTAAEQEPLADLFGAPHRWGETLRGIPWMTATLVVPPFEASTLAHLDVPCTYDFDVAATRYLSALRGGEIPLELLFSGTVFHLDGDRLQATLIPWDREAACRLPVATWRAAIDHHFPDSAWLRLNRTAFDRLAAFRAVHSLTSWEAAIDVLLGETERKQTKDREEDAATHTPRGSAEAADAPPRATAT